MVKIADGDTLTILDKSNRQHKVRLICIDVPERKQPFGTVSRQNLAHMVFGKTVAVEWHKQDRYQRILGKVLLDGKDVNLEQIQVGLAWHYKQYDKDQQLADRRLYAEAQKAASLKGIGLWSDPAPIAPWNFRHNKPAPSVADEACEIRFAGFRYKMILSFVGFVGMLSSLPPLCPDSWSLCVLQRVLFPMMPIESMPVRLRNGWIGYQHSFQ